MSILISDEPLRDPKSERLAGMQIAVRLLALVLIALGAYLIEHFFKRYLVFSLNWGQRPALWDSLALLPIVLIGQVFLQAVFIGRKQLGGLTALFYSVVFLLLFFSPTVAGIVWLSLGLLYFLEHFSREARGSTWLLGILILMSAVIPILFYELQTSLSVGEVFFLVLFKSCLLMRIISWLIDRRIYRRRSFDSLSEYVEFLVCPVFFIFPGQIQFFLFDYFHQKKKPASAVTIKNTVPVAFWGMLLMVIFSYGNHLFWQHYEEIPLVIERYGYWPIQFGIGFLWLILIYFQQTAGMAYQVALARVVGYDFKYDMHQPLLARTPLDYLRRHSSYVKDYIVEMGLKPAALGLLRRGYGINMVLPFASILSYAVFISFQTGYRPDYHRTFAVTGAMIFFLTLFIYLPFAVGFFKRRVENDSLLRESSFKPLRDWGYRDYLMWVGTLLILSVYKAILGIVK